MPARNLIRVYLVVFLLSGLLGACAPHRTGIAVPRRLPLQAGYEALSPRVAVDVNGGNHLVYLEQDAFDSRLVYAYQKGLEQPSRLVIPLDSGLFSYHHPDIAVTADGRVFLAWQAVDTTRRQLHNCYAVLRPTDTTPPGCTPLATGISASQPPTLAAFENTVYAVYSFRSAATQGLRATRLEPESSEYVNLFTWDGPLEFQPPALAVSDEGMLHVAFTYRYEYVDTGDVYYTLGYQRYTAEEGHTGDLHALIVPEGFRLEAPALALDRLPGTQDRATVVYTRNPLAAGSSPTHIFAYTHESYTNNDFVEIHPLRVVDAWQIPAAPALIYTEGVARMYFAGSKADTRAVVDVYGMNITHDGEEALYASETEQRDNPPLAALSWQPDPHTGILKYSPVVVWRAAPTWGLFGDVWTLAEIGSYGNPLVRLASFHPNGNTDPGFDLDAFADSTFAAWVDAVSTTDLRSAIWVSWNEDQVFLPVAQR